MGLRRKTPMARGGRINPVSARRRARDEPYPERRRQVYARANGRCEFVDETNGRRCPGRMAEVHHLQGRGGPDPHRLELLVGLCGWHHDRIHANPAWAYTNGWMIRRTTRKEPG